MATRAPLVLAIVATDSTFEKSIVRGTSCWVGRCIHCNAKIVVEEDGTTLGTIEHITPKNHGGTDDVENLSLACARCNGQKGVRHDNRRKNDPKLVALIASLMEKKRARARE